VKRVLAWSTMSQIGYMMLAAGLGVAGYAYAIFHLLTHGFFKANMFLGAGSVMHAMDDEVDMRRYGALRKALPVTFLTFAMGYLAIIGFPGFSGFWSKDKIIETAFGESLTLGLAALLGAGITAFYMTRLMLMTFFGDKRWREGVKPHESPKVMTVPLVVLAALSVLGGVLYLGGWIKDFLKPVVGEEAAHSLPLPAIAYTLIVTAVVAVGVAVAWMTVGRNEVPLTAPAKVSVATRAARADLYGDAFNEAVLMRPGNTAVDAMVRFDDDGLDRGLVDGTGRVAMGMASGFRRAQNGYVRSYALSLFLGALVVTFALLAVSFA
jgi:NADH-quinone oxidoreductase subunit L